MANQRSTFAKRQREQDLKNKARAKQERLAARRSETRDTKGPLIAWDEAVQVNVGGDETPAVDPVSLVPTDDSPTGGS